MAGIPINVYSAEADQDGSTTIVSSGSTPVDRGAVPSGNFVDGNRHLILACGRLASSGRIGLRLNVSGAFYDVSQQLPYTAFANQNEMWATNRLLTLNSIDDVKVEAIWTGGNAGLVRQTNLVIIDLDSGNLFEGRDWYHDENSTVLAQMDSVFANNVGSSLRIRPDGASSYLILGHARLSASASTSITVEAAMQLWDKTNSVELSKAGWQRWLNTAGRSIVMNCMAIVTPPAGNLDLSVRCVGGTVTPPDGWDLEESSITVLRLDQFTAAGFDQNLSLNQVGPGNTMPPSGGAVSPQASFSYQADVLGDMVTMAFTQADNSADDEEGIASQAQFSSIDAGDRSLWDTENAVLGGSVGLDETNNISTAGGSVTTRAATWGVSHRTNVSQVSSNVEWANGGRSGNSSVVERVVIASFGRETVDPPAQAPAPTPVTIPSSPNLLPEKLNGEHEAEALDNQLEQFKP